MSCDFYKKFELGRIKHNQFWEHANQCKDCQTEIERDKVLLQAVREADSRIEVPDIWDCLSAGIDENTVSLQHAERKQPFNVLKNTLRVAAIFLVGLIATIVYFNRPIPDSEKILDNRALIKVERMEKEYLKAIDALEQRASIQMAEMDTDLMLLYREKLETLDLQINRCREAAERNPANYHIRRYLLAALQEKKETCQEILHYKSQNS